MYFSEFMKHRLLGTSCASPTAMTYTRDGSRAEDAPGMCGPTV